MTLIAGASAVRRTERRYRGMWLDSIVSMWATSWLMAAVAVFGVVQVPGAAARSWYNPQYAVPLLGMILGNTLNGISLGLDRLGSELASSATRSTPCWPWAPPAGRRPGPIQQAVRTGMIPTINMMMVVGLVSLPGMMTGQLIAGQDPEQAVRIRS